MKRKYPPSWEEPLRDYQASLAGSGKSGRTVEVRTYHLERFAGSVTVPPAMVTTPMLLDHLATASWGSHTKRTVRASLVSFFEWAKSTGLVKTNIARPIPEAPLPARQPRPVSKETVAKAMTEAEPRTRLMISLIVVGGLRVMEVANCHTRDVHPLPDGNYTFRGVGTNGRTRTIPLRPDLAEAVLDLGEGFAFPGRINGHVSPAYVSRLVSQALPADLNAGMLRHAYKAGQITLAWREFSAFHSTKTLHLLTVSELAENRSVLRDLDRIDQRLGSRDFAGVIEACKMLTETVFKVVLDDFKVPYGTSEKLPGLFSKVSTKLAHSGPKAAREATATNLRVLNAIVDGMAATRNKVDGHGSAVLVEVNERHARLVLNATVALTEYVAATWRPDASAPL